MTINEPCNLRQYDVTELDYQMADAVLGNLSEYNLRDLLALNFARGRELIALKELILPQLKRDDQQAENIKMIFSK